MSISLKSHPPGHLIQRNEQFSSYSLYQQVVACLIHILIPFRPLFLSAIEAKFLMQKKIGQFCFAENKTSKNWKLPSKIRRNQKGAQFRPDSFRKAGSHIFLSESVMCTKYMSLVSRLCYHAKDITRYNHTQRWFWNIQPPHRDDDDHHHISMFIPMELSRSQSRGENISTTKSKS